ncbi:10222_t:CDS:2, partial [Funneliformis mosseae]
SKVLPVIVLVWKMKMIVKDTFEFVEQKSYLEDQENTDDQLQNLQKVCESFPSRKKIIQSIVSDSLSSNKKA